MAIGIVVFCRTTLAIRVLVIYCSCWKSAKSEVGFSAVFC
jgi:hypothetical protein